MHTDHLRSIALADEAPDRPRAASALGVRADATPAMADAYVDAHPFGRSYHKHAWMRVVSEAFGHQSKYLVAERGNVTVGVLPVVGFNSRLFGRFMVSMPFLNYGGVLADDVEAERALLAHAIELTRHSGGRHLELRHDRQHFSELAAKRHKVAMELRLAATAEDQWRVLDRKLRNQVRKAEKSGLQIHDGSTELLDRFYDVFARNMRDLGTPVYAKEFFRRVLVTFPEQTRVVVVSLNEQPIAASILHWYRQRIEVPWASSLREFNSLCANVLLYWHMLRFAIERGFEVFDFGRSTPGEGTYQFKKQWGAEPRELVWEYWTAEGGSVPELNPHNPKFALAIRAWQRLPVPVANALGPHIVRNIP